MEVQRDESFIKTVLRNEVTWVVFVVVGVMGFVSQVALPLQRMQIQLSQIQVDIGQSKSDYSATMTELILLRSRMDIMETEVRPLLNR